MKFIPFYFSFLFLCSLITACSSGGDSSEEIGGVEEETNPPLLEILNGQIVGLHGFTFEAGDLRGITGSNGEFQFRQGDRVEFFVGDISLGSTAAASLITVDDLVDSEDHAFNLKSFLAALDYDQSTENGILATESIRDAARGRVLSFLQNRTLFKRRAEAVLEGPIGTEVDVAAFDLYVARTLEDANNPEQNATIAETFVYPKAVVSNRVASASFVSASNVVMQSSISSSFDSFDTLEEEALAVIDLMLLNTLNAGESPLDYIFKATGVPLRIESSEQEGALVDLYYLYKQRLPTIGRQATYVHRHDLVDGSVMQGEGELVHHLAVMSDFQMRDDESPLQVQFIKPILASAYYPASAHIAYAVDAMVRTMRDYEAAIDLPIDMAIFTGDLIDIGHYNEVRWGIEVLDGGDIHPDSGADDDFISGTFSNDEPNDTSDPFTALGLNGFNGRDNIPWYYVPGNHDGLVMGVVPITDEPFSVFGEEIRGGTRDLFEGIALGDVNYLGFEPTFSGLLKQLFSLPSKKRIPADENRRLMNPQQVALEMFDTTSEPIGHGMHLVEDLSADLRYSFTMADDRIRHIVLDTNIEFSEGYVSNEELAWLEGELAAATAANQLVIVSSHHKPKDILLTGNKLVNLLNAYPNVIAHLVAHSHINQLMPRLGTTAAEGYWEIESGSMVNWPQQFRMLEISLDVEAGVGVIKTTLLNHQSENPLAVSERGRFLSYIEAYLEGKSDPEGHLVSIEGAEEDRNTFLYFKIPDTLLQNL